MYARESSTRLYHTYARYYSPILQRFLSEDPLQFIDGDANLFTYAGNNPINLIDPMGTSLAGVVASGVEGALVVGTVVIAASTGAVPATVLAVTVGATIAGGVAAITAAESGGSPADAFALTFGISAASGLLAEGAIAVTGGTEAISIPGRAVTGGLVGVGATFVSQTLHRSPFGIGQAALAFGAGFTGGAAGGGYLATAEAAEEVQGAEAVATGLGSVFGEFVEATFGVLVDQSQSQGRQPESFFGSGSGFQPALHVPSNLSMGLVSPGPAGSTLSGEIPGATEL